MKKVGIVLEPSLDTDFHPSWKKPDGIHWSDYNDGKPVSHRAADTHNQILWDPISQSYRLLTRTDLGGGGGASESRSTRIMTHTAENDVMKHPAAWKTVIDKIKVDDPKKEKNRWGKPRLQFNGMTMRIRFRLHNARLYAFQIQ